VLWAAACMLCLSMPPTVNAATAQTTLQGNRILLVTSAQDAGMALADILAEIYDADVSIKDPDSYDPLIDEYYYDGLVYLGADYYKPPKQGLVEDVQNTRKPVLWLGYHGWLLDPDYLAAKGIMLHDRHRGPISNLDFGGEIAMEPREVAIVDSKPDSVLYWVIDADGQRSPGAVHAGNLTYVAYVPEFDLYGAELAPLLAAIRSAFGNAVPPRSPEQPPYAARVKKARADRFRTGIHLPVYVARTTDTTAGYDADQWHANLMRIKRSGAEWVNVVRTYYMHDLKASTVEADPALTPTLDSLANIVADAHKLGLLVRLHPAINLVERSPLEWHGMIRPADRKRWWASFSAKMRELAGFARTHEIESLMLGTEFTSMQHDGADWRRLIEMVRNDVGYPGLIGYGVNYNSLDIDWLDALDFFSISAYWPLSETRDPKLPALMRSWRSIDKQLRRWKNAHPAIPLELGEIGYVSQPYASVLPFSWKAHKGEQQDLGEQLTCYESVREFLKTASYISGVHFFASTAEDTEPDSLGYTPFGKPAEKVMDDIIKMR
jgi:hypothetical protein